MSLTMAAVPYRIIFLDLDDLRPFFVILFIESLYKVLVYPLNLSLRFISAKESLNDLRKSLQTSPRQFVSRFSSPVSLTLTAVEVTLASRSLALQSSLALSLSSKFVIHNFLDTSAALGVMYLFFFLRRSHGMPFSPQGGTAADEDRRFNTLMLEYAVGVMLECALYPLYYLGITRGLGLREFKLHFWSFLERDHLDILLAQGVTYFTIFCLVDMIYNGPV